MKMEDNKEEPKKYNLGIIANPVADEGKNIYLTKFLSILKPLSNEIFVINGDFPEVRDRRIHVIKIKTDLKKELMLIRSIKFILIQWRFAFNLMKISKKIDVVFFFGATEVISLLLMKLMRTRTIVIAGGSAWKTADKLYQGRSFGLGVVIFPFILRTLEKISFTFSDRIAVESESAIEFLGLERYKDKITIISNMYLDLNQYKIIKKLKDKRNLIGYIGRLSVGKGIMNFVNALSLILKERSDLEFLIGGDGPLFDEIKNELEKNGLCNHVKLTGWIPYNEVPDYLNELKLLIFPSYSEGLPNIVSEAMACGAVVVATPVGGVPDLIEDGETGFTIEDNTPEYIGKMVIKVLEFPNLEEITSNARKIIEEKYTYDAVVEKYKIILEEIGRMNYNNHNEL